MISPQCHFGGGFHKLQTPDLAKRKLNVTTYAFVNRYPWLQGNLNENDPSGNVTRSIVIHEDVEVLHLQLVYLQFLVPLYENVHMGSEIKIDEPLEKLVIVN